MIRYRLHLQLTDGDQSSWVGGCDAHAANHFVCYFFALLMTLGNFAIAATVIDFACFIVTATNMFDSCNSNNNSIETTSKGRQ